MDTRGKDVARAMTEASDEERITFPEVVTALSEVGIERYHADLARAARTLAWSEDDPRVEQTSGLATRVRTTIDLTSENGNGRVH